MILEKYNFKTDFTVDKRKYFRIDDDVSLSVEPIDKLYNYDSLQNYYDEKLAKQGVSNEVSYADEKILPVAKVIQNKHPDVYEYIRHLESKIDIIYKKIELDSPNVNKCADMQRVNISASGMNFVSPKKYSENDFVEVLITLYPSNKIVYLIAKILRVNILSVDRVSTSMEFLIINDANKELLIKHIHTKQLENLHKRNG